MTEKPSNYHLTHCYIIDEGCQVWMLRLTARNPLSHKYGINIPNHRDFMGAGNPVPLHPKSRDNTTNK